MSFSSEVKEELSLQMASARHCQIAEITAIISMCGRVSISTRDAVEMKIQTENLYVARKFAALLKKTFHIIGEVAVKIHGVHGQNRTYTVAVRKHEDALRVLNASRLVTPELEIAENLSLVNNLIVQKSCCRRAFIRGAFLVAGSISDPEKFYHFEIVCSALAKAEQIKNIISCFYVEAKIIERKKHFVVYVKEGSGIVDMLNIMEAHISLMELENVRILKEMRNSVNRKFNCEMANLNKTVSAAVRQIEDIKYINDTVGLSHLPGPLMEIAKLRLENPDSSLKELGEMLSSPVGKSGVNHRLRKISGIADDLRK